MKNSGSNMNGIGQFIGYFLKCNSKIRLNKIKEINLVISILINNQIMYNKFNYLYSSFFIIAQDMRRIQNWIENQKIMR